VLWLQQNAVAMPFENRLVRRVTSPVSRAFIKETDDRPEELLERRVSTHSNLVTREGLASIEKHLAAAAAALEAAQSAGDDAALARAARDVRYWQSRRHTARLMPEPKADGTIQFGHAVTIRRGDGRQQIFRIVGEDEADPRCGRISYGSPLARALLESRIGDTVRIGASEAAIVKVG
jgi:transcription elongation GreA/GreB family factor